jgi:putative transposase
VTPSPARFDEAHRVLDAEITPAEITPGVILSRSDFHTPGLVPAAVSATSSAGARHDRPSFFEFQHDPRFGRLCAKASVVPRRLLHGTAGLAFHVMNRGERRSTLFFSHTDYAAFIATMIEAAVRVPMRLIALQLMPNHWHLVLWPFDDTGLTRYTGWLSLTHACRWQRVHGTRGTGPVYQGRFKAIPIETGEHFLTVCRYVERNAVRAGLVERASDWPWSSASAHPGAPMPALHEWPVPRPPGWNDILDRPEPGADIERIRRCVSRSAPIGDDPWFDDVVARLSWTTGLRPAGRPRTR